MHVLILTEGNHKIGMGHVHRSINLAKSLKNRKNKVTFMTKDPISKKMISKNNDCKLYERLNFSKNKKFLEKLRPDIIVLDKLNENKNNLKILNKICKKIIVIDYRGSNKNLIYYGINILYPKTGFNKRAVSGFKYAIIDEGFAKRKIKRINKKIKSVIVLQGGSDTYCITPKIIRSLNESTENFSIATVVGPGFKCKTKLKNVLKSTKRKVRIFHNAKMSTILSRHDLAITAAGNSLLELACIGMPSIVVCGEKFEVETADIMQKKGFCKNLGFGKDISQKKIASNIDQLISNLRLRKKMNRVGKKLVDGKGSERVVDLITKIHNNGKVREIS